VQNVASSVVAALHACTVLQNKILISVARSPGGHAESHDGGHRVVQRAITSERARERERRFPRDAPRRLIRVYI